MTFLASLAGERLFFDGDHTTGVGGDMRGATAIATQMHAFYAMGDTIAARSVTLGAMRGAQPAETGTDRALFDTEFGKGVEAGLQPSTSDPGAPRREPARGPLRRQRPGGEPHHHR